MRPIPGHADYFVDEDGVIWSAKSGAMKRMQTFVRRRSGHHGINLTQNGKYRMFYAHTLVALAFIGAKPDGAIVMHLDDNPVNNRPDNLAYGTPAANSTQMTSRGRQSRGERHPNAKLTVEVVREARRRIASGESQLAVARDIGISTSTMNSIHKGRIWNHA